MFRKDKEIEKYKRLVNEQIKVIDLQDKVIKEALAALKRQDEKLEDMEKLIEVLKTTIVLSGIKESLEKGV